MVSRVNTYKIYFFFLIAGSFKEMDMSEKPLGTFGSYFTATTLRTEWNWSEKKKVSWKWGWGREVSLGIRGCRTVMVRDRKRKNNSSASGNSASAELGWELRGMRKGGEEEREDYDAWKQTSPPFLILWRVPLWSLLCCIKAKTASHSLSSHRSCNLIGKGRSSGTPVRFARCW